MQKVKPVSWLMKMSKKQRLNMALLIFFNAVFSVLSILFAFAIKGIIDGAVVGEKVKLISYSVFICSIVVMQFILRVAVNGLTEHIRGKLEMQIKSYMFCNILEKKHEKINVYHSGELMNRLTSDVSVVSEGVTSIVPSVVSALVRLGCAVIALILLDWVFAIAFSVAGLLVFSVIGLLRGKLKGLHKKTQETDGKVRSFMQECIENLLAVKVFSVNDKIEKQADELQEKNFKVKMTRKNYSVVGHATYNFIFSAGYLFALIYGGVKILGGLLSYGSLSAILQLVNNVQVPFASLSNVVPKYYAMLASAERLMEIENIEGEPTERIKDRDALYDKTNSIVVEDLCFSYDRDKVLSNASVRINKGDFVLIEGASGIGKSTLMKLMLGVYSVDSGEIYIDCNDKNDPKVSLGCKTRNLFSYVPQGNMLFSGTLKDNVTFIKQDATDAQIERALEISCARDFIDTLPQGLDTVVGENGVGLSEGQIQRIAIARAVLCNAPVILLDEATSALDEDTERRVLDNLKGLNGITLVIVSHKKAAQSICNKKLTVRNKKIFEQVL